MSESRIRSWIEDGVGHLRIDRPERRNAVDEQTVLEARAAVESFLAADVAVAVLEAEGSVFCAGGDRSEAGTGKLSTTRLAQLLLAHPIYWAARVQGPVIGGGISPVVACPLAFCTPNAWFDMPEARLGFLPGPLLAFLEPVLGRRRALSLCVSAARLEPPAAAELGLVDRVLDPADLDRELRARTAALRGAPDLARAAAQAWQGPFRTPAFEGRLAELISLIP